MSDSTPINQGEAEILRGALEPFARALDEWGDDAIQPDGWNVWEHPIAQCVTLGDFRRAAQALAAFLSARSTAE